MDATVGRAVADCATNSLAAARRRVIGSVFHRSFVWLVFACIVTGVTTSDAASKRSQNFYVEADTQALADAVATHAERYRRELAEYWLGKELPPWPQPCPIKVISGPRLAAQGATTYNPRPVSNFRMEVIGTTERILDSVLPHEVTHTVMATHFGRPLPRWADEGICTTVEHAAERNKHERKLREFLRTDRGIAMNRLFLLTEYPQDMLPMYAQGYSVCRFLVEQQGPRRFIEFLEDWMQSRSWTGNVQKHYGYESLSDLQENWLNWVSDGSGSVEGYVASNRRGSVTLASAESTNTGKAQIRQASLIGPGSSIDQRAASLSGPLSRQNAQAAAGGMTLSAPASNSNRSMAIHSLGSGASSESWYKRKRDETARGKIATTEEIESPRSQTGFDSPAPTGRSDYSVSQPQPELRYGQLR
ncbi:hypothetical protein [Roseiconus lacunae]|uniref:hypothetical protein n=1 Tax=Roseiconus lacunae TaxID=2605694 RepID=UPI001E5E1A31|nr:hypothetical protein [Roseiconus lacunae]MCD0463088.1 hypothetical protein [Roseiconus lacunae]